MVVGVDCFCLVDSSFIWFLGLVATGALDPIVATNPWLFGAGSGDGDSDSTDLVGGCFGVLSFGAWFVGGFGSNRSMA